VGHGTDDVTTPAWFGGTDPENFGNLITDKICDFSLAGRSLGLYVLSQYILWMLKPFLSKTGNHFMEIGYLLVIGLSLTPSH